MNGVLYNKVSYDLFPFRLKIRILTQRTNFVPFLVFWHDHLRSNLEIISWLEIICGRGSFVVLYRSSHLFFLSGSASGVAVDIENKVCFMRSKFHC